MKQLRVSEKCNGCGACVIKCSYFTENDEGNAVPIEGKAVSAADLGLVQRVIEECPQKAITMIEVSSATKSGKEGLTELLKKLENKEKTLQVPRVEASEIEFSAEDYPMIAPFSPKEYMRAYSSESQAKSAARDEFDRLCYSQSAYRPILKKIFVEYKVRNLKPYYTNGETEGGFYYHFNRSIEKFLKEIYEEAAEVSSGALKLPENWSDFKVYLKDSDWELSLIRDFDGASTGSGIMEEFKSNGEYTSLKWYVDRMDFDYDEVYAGEGMFGKMKLKKQWYFTGFRSAAEEFVSDLKKAVGYRSSDITARACDLVNCAITNYEIRVKEALRGKIEEFKKVIKQ